MTRWPRLHVAAALALTLLLVVLATSARQPKPEPLRHASYVDAGGLRLRYVRAGSGPTLVLLHGYGESMIAWRGMFDRLAQHADVIAMDLPGFGLSSKPPSGYFTDSMATRVRQALESLGVRRTAIVGHSLGGAVAAAVVSQSPDRITRLVLLDAALVGPPAVLPEAGGESETVDAARRAIAEYEAMRTRFMSPHEPHWLAEDDSAAAYMPAGDPDYRVALAAVLREFDFAWLTRERVARVSVPTLVLWGEYDPVFPVSAGRALAAALPDARFEVVDRTWHRPHEERPDATASAIEQFLFAQTGDSGPRSP